jgi:serine/threonine protein phosphatase PrpC
MGAACGCAAEATAPVIRLGATGEAHIGPTGVATKQGKSSKPNQDRYVIAPNVGGYEGAHLFAVFDVCGSLAASPSGYSAHSIGLQGHGKHGHDVSSFLRDNYARELCKSPQFPKNPAKALASACLSVNEKLQQTSLDSDYSG